MGGGNGDGGGGRGRGGAGDGAGGRGGKLPSAEVTCQMSQPPGLQLLMLPVLHSPSASQ